MSRRWAKPTSGQVFPTACRSASLAAGLLALGFGATSCVKRLAMAELDGVDPAQPHTVLLYSGVREGSRRYADYGAIDARILESK
jgi:hypothetical protein